MGRICIYISFFVIGRAGQKRTIIAQSEPYCLKKIYRTLHTSTCKSVLQKKTALSWMLQALNNARRLVTHHAGVLGPQLHSFVLLALPSVEALRSTTTKIGMLLLQVSLTMITTVTMTY